MPEFTHSESFAQCPVTVREKSLAALAGPRGTPRLPDAGERRGEVGRLADSLVAEPLAQHASCRGHVPVRTDPTPPPRSGGAVG